MGAWRDENGILLRGRLAGKPVFSHTNHGVRYHVFPLVVRRLSEVEDQLNVVVPEHLLRNLSLESGEMILVEGEVRSFNNRSGRGSRLVITVYARKVQRDAGEEENKLHLVGTLCKPPSPRRTPLGRDICDLMVAVNRRYGRTDYLPVIAWGGLARACGGLSVGDTVRLEGRLQSRSYTKQMEASSEERVAFEVSVMTLERIGTVDERQDVY